MQQFGNETDAAFRKAEKSVSRISLSALPEHERAVVKVQRQYQNLGSQIDQLSKSGRISKEIADQWHRDIGVRMQNDLDALEKKGSLSFNSLSTAAKGFVASFVTLSAGVVVQDIAATTMKFQGMESALKTVTGSSAAAKAELGYIREEADRLGLGVLALADDYTKLVAASKGTSLEGQKTRDIFTAVAEAGRVLNLSEADVSGALRSIQQMMSKGNVQAEELRGQLGERLPGAFQMAARSMGVTDAQLNKMLENGEVLAADLLPKLAVEIRKTFGPGVEDAADNAAAAFGRFKNSILELENAIGSSGIIDFMAKTAEIGGKSIQGWTFLAQAPGIYAEGLKVFSGEQLKVFQEADLMQRKMMVEFEQRRRSVAAISNSLLDGPTKTGTFLVDGALASQMKPDKKAGAAAKKAAAEAKKTSDQRIKDIDSTMDRLLPLKKEQEEYAHDMAILDSQYAQGKISVAEYVTAQDNLIASTKEYKAAQEEAKKADKDAKEEKEKLKKINDAYSKAVLSALPEQEQAVAKVAQEYDELRQSVIDMWAANGIGDDEMRQRLTALDERQYEQEAEALEKLKDKGEDTAKALDDAFSGWASNMSKDFNDMLWSADFSFQGIGESFAKMITQMMIQASIIQPMMNSIGAGGGASGILGGIVSLFFGSPSSTPMPGLSQVDFADSIFSNTTSLPWAADGYDVPPGVNPLTQLHAEEMVLPAKYADVIRGLAQSGSGNGGGNITVNLIEAPGKGGQTQQRNDSNGGNVLDVFVEQIKGSIAVDIVRGDGAIPAAMGNTYGLNRVPGGY